MRCGDYPGSRLIVGYSEVGQGPVIPQGAVVVEFDVPGECRGSRIRIERRRHLSSVRVAVRGPGLHEASKHWRS